MGYNLDCSLFERLCTSGYPVCSLTHQYNMHSDIAGLINLHYPGLRISREPHENHILRGFQENVVFVNVSSKKKEIVAPGGSQDSFQNEREGDMTHKCLQYLVQQNYKTEDIVVLTPCSGQVALLRGKLSQTFNVALNNVDLRDAGLRSVSMSSSPDNKPWIRLSTIENYEDGPYDIVIASLVRNNTEKDISPMDRAGRLHRLISTARNGLIVVGNAETFMRTESKRHDCNDFTRKLEHDGKIYNGFPLKCEKHPEHLITARCPGDFDLKCPDGGCAKPCKYG
ncbi:AAA domain-containing protein [Xylariaceae sp. FL0255]|nr:AAA domain-containing protein [Xylariaceae sp. FL0255]